MLDLQVCQTACKLQVTLALLQQFCQLVCLASCSRERAKHVGLNMGKCVFSSFNLFSALTWSARCPRSHPKRRSVATPALNPNAPARCWLAGECASSSATPSAPRASPSRLSSGMLSSTIDAGSGCAPPRPVHCVFLTFPRHSSARPEPHLVLGSVALGLLLVPLHVHQVLLLHHVANLSDTLLSSVLFLLPSWRFQLRVVDGILQSVLELACPPGGIGTRGILQSVHVS